jgi:CheY-like chemotaxis protein
MWKNILNWFGNRNNNKAKFLANKTILVVEDGATERTFISKVLTGLGCRVLTADNGKAGLDEAIARMPDLILLDYRMPGLNGNEVCQKLKANDKTKAIPVVFLTGSTTNVVECYDVGADYYLAKPISAKALIRQLELTFQELAA